MWMYENNSLWTKNVTNKPVSSNVGIANIWTCPITKVCQPNAITTGSNRLWRNGWIWPNWKSSSARKKRWIWTRYVKARWLSNTRRPATTWPLRYVTWVEKKNWQPLLLCLWSRGYYWFSYDEPAIVYRNIFKNIFYFGVFSYCY